MKELFYIITTSLLLLGEGLGMRASAQIITTIAGNGIAGSTGDGGAATAAEFKGPNSVTFDAHNNFYIADSGTATIRMVNTAGIISRVAGSIFGGGYSGDGGAATIASLFRPTDVAFDAMGNMYIADQGNQVIRKVNTAGIISTFAGNGISGFSGDGGQATAAEFNNPQNLTVDAAGNLYIADKGNNRIRRVSTSGIISTVAGTGTAGYSGDGGQATAAEINGAYDVAFDASGNMYLADCYNYRIRKVNAAGIISTVVGNGTGGYSGDGGQATAAGLYWPAGIIFDGAGNMYISDFGTDRVRMVNTVGIISTVAGNGTWAYSGDGGLATAAELNGPYGIAFDAFSNLYIADLLNNRIRMVTNVAVAGIEQFVVNSEQLSVYPNPAKDVLNVECLMINEKATVTMIDMIGNVIYYSAFTAQHNTINVADLIEGVYNISITSNGAIANKRVVIIH
jgi:sugar lactone lactonase YvrE